MLPFSRFGRVVRLTWAFGSLVYALFDEFRIEVKRRAPKKEARPWR